MWIPWTCHRLTGARDCKSCRLCRKDEKGCASAMPRGKPLENYGVFLIFIQDACHGFKTFAYICPEHSSFKAEAEATRPPTPTTPAKVPVAPRVKPQVDAAGLQGFRRLMAAYGCMLRTTFRMRCITFEVETGWNWNDLEWDEIVLHGYWQEKHMTKYEWMRMIHRDVKQWEVWS